MPLVRCARTSCASGLRKCYFLNTEMVFSQIKPNLSDGRTGSSGWHRAGGGNVVLQIFALHGGPHCRPDTDLVARRCAPSMRKYGAVSDQRHRSSV